jgi:hypothetical protein
MDTQKIQAELQKFAIDKFKIDPALLADDPTFEEMNADSMSRLEILLYGDDTFGSHVLDYIEDGLIEHEPPSRLSELAQLIPKCMVPVKELKVSKKNHQV